MRSSFVLYTEIGEVLKELTDEQKGQLFQAIIDYQISGEMPDISGVVRVAFIPIKQDLDANNEKWERTRKARSEAGKKGMRNRYSKDNKLANDSAVITNDNKDNKVKEGVTNLTDNVNVNVDVDVNDINNISTTPAAGTTRSPKHKYGEYKHVLLTDAEMDRLNADYGEYETREAIKYLDEYIEMKGTKYKSHNLALRKWVFDACRKNRQRYGGDSLPFSGLEI